MYRHKYNLIVAALALTCVGLTLLAQLSGAQQSARSSNEASRQIANARSKKQRSRPRERELIMDTIRGKEPASSAKEQKSVLKLRLNPEWDSASGRSAQSASTPQPPSSSTTTGTKSSSVRLTVSDIGPETGFSGAFAGFSAALFFGDVEVERIEMPFSSGTNFTFNRDTRQMILPTRQRVFRSVNGGVNWSPVNVLDDDGVLPGRIEGANFVRQDSRNPQVLHAVGAHGGRLFRSSDFGTTWTELGVFNPSGLFQQNFADVAVHQSASNVVLALKRSSDELEGPALWRSEDGGATFTPQWNTGLPQGLCDYETDTCSFANYSNIATTPADPNIVYVVQDAGDETQPEGIWKSIDGGLTFSRLEASPFGLFQVFPHPTRPEVVFAQSLDPFNNSTYRSMDGGVSFQPVMKGLTRQNFFVSFDRNNPSLVYVAGRGGAFRSQDSGETFQPLGLTAEQIGKFATNVNVDPSDSKALYVNTFNGNFKSTNGGKTFTAINNGWKAAIVNDIAFDNNENPNLYLATANGIMRTSTHGQQYDNLSDGHQSTIFADDFESDPSSRWTISRESTDPSTFVPRDWTWVHTLPDGRAGSAFFAPDPAAPDLCSAPLPGQVGVLLLESPRINWPRNSPSGLRLAFDHWVSLERGFDGGQLMISVNSGPYSLVDKSDFVSDGYNFILFPFEQNNPRFGQLAWSGNLKPWGTTNVDLSRYAKPGDSIRLRWDMSTDYCFGTDAGWYVDNVRVYATDGAPSALNYTDKLAIAGSNPNMIVAGTSNGTIYRTLDGGQSWIRSSVDTGLVLVSQLAIDPRDFSNVYFLGTQINARGEFIGSGFYKSADAGATFSLQDATDFKSLAIDPQDPSLECGAIDCNDCSPVKMSSDGGRTWGPIPGAMTFQSVRPSGQGLLIDPTDPKNNFLLGKFIFYEDPLVEHTLVRSTDMSITFSPADGGLPGCESLVMNPRTPSRLYCTDWSLRMFSVTSDSGNTWASVSASEIFKSAGLGKSMVLNPKKVNLLNFVGSSLLEVQVHEK